MYTQIFTQIEGKKLHIEVIYIIMSQKVQEIDALCRMILVSGNLKLNKRMWW